jgi:hypothetical protein
MQYKTAIESAKDEWLAAHPEYLPENDPDDKNWGALHQTVLGYFKMPENPKDIKKVLDAAHKIVKPFAELPVKSRAEVNAAKEKITISSKGAGGGAKPEPIKSAGSYQIADVLKHTDFTEDEARDLFS